MKLSDPNKINGIVEDVHFICGTNSNSYPTADIARNANRWAYKAVTWIFKASHHFQWDDRNHANRAIGKFDLVDGQDWYTQPTDLLKIDQIHLKDSDGEWYKLKHIDQSEHGVALDEVYNTKGKPIYYDVYGEEFRLLPAADSNDVTLSNGGRIFYPREIDLFEVSDTAQQPGFSEPFHRICSFGASYDFLISHKPDEAQVIRQEIEQLKQELFEFYSDFNRDVKVQVKPNNARRSTRRQWE